MSLEKDDPIALLNDHLATLRMLVIIQTMAIAVLVLVLVGK